MMKWLFVVAAAIAVAQAADTIVHEDDVPTSAKMTTADGNVVFDMPPGKSVTVNRYQRALDADALEADISGIESEVVATDEVLSSVAALIGPLATKGPVNTIENQVDALNLAVNERVRSDELEGLSSLVGVIASTANAAQSIGEDANMNFPSIRSTIAETNSLATVAFTKRLDQVNVLNEIGSQFNVQLAPGTSTLRALASDMDVAADVAVSQVNSLTQKVSMAEENVAKLESISNFVEHFSQTHFGNGHLPVFRFAEFSTYAQCCGWYWGNRVEFYGGVNPSSWSNGNGRADQMSADPAILRNLFNKAVHCGYNCAVHNEEWYSYSSDNGRHGAVLMRVKNNNEMAIDWKLEFFYSSYGGWSEAASLSLNGQNVWSTTANCGRCIRQQTITIPPSKTSTIILVVGSSPQSGTRTSHLAFYNDCLDLPDGLEWVDDLDVIEEL